MIQANNSKSNKIQNRQIILKLLAMKAPISRVELSVLSGLSKMSLTNIISEFKEEGFIMEVGVDTTAEGKRKPVLLELADGVINALGVVVTQTEILSCFADIKGNVLKFDTCPLPAGEFTDSVVSYIQNTLKNAPCTVLGVGVAFEASLNVEVSKTIQTALEQADQDVSFHFANDAQCALMAEKRYGGAKGLDCVLYATYGKNNLCCALYANKKLLQGFNGNAGIVPCESQEEAIGKLKDLIAFSDPQAVLFEEEFARYDVCRKIEKDGIPVRLCALGRQAPILGSATLVFESEYFS